MLCSPGIGIRNMLRLETVIQQDLDMDTSSSTMDAPLIWKSQLQAEIALSSTEREYPRLSYALHESIPFMSLLDELKECGFPEDQT